jgi:hypothetical protein
VRFVAFQNEEPKKQASEPATQPAPTQPPTDTKPATDKDGKPEISVTITDSAIYLRSDDLDALDDFELLLRDIINQRGMAPALPTIIYLKYLKSSDAKVILDEVLGLGGGGAGGMLGGLASNLMGGVGGDLLGGLLGGGGDAGGSTVQTTGDVQLTSEPRLNALIVQANEMDLELIEDMLIEIDRPFAPQDPKAYGETFIIPIYYMTADDVANVVKQSLPQQIYTEGSGQERQQQQTQQFLQQMLRGGGRRGGRGGGGGQQSVQEQKMTIGVDPRSNSLIVTGPEHLYLRVLGLVEKLDRRGIADNEAVTIVTLRGNVNSALLANALQSILGDKIETNASSSGDTTTTGTTTSGTSRSGTTSRTPSSTPSRATQPSGNSGEDFRRTMEAIQRLRGGGTQGGGRGGAPGGGRTGGGPGAAFGGGRTGGGPGGRTRGGR